MAVTKVQTVGNSTSNGTSVVLNITATTGNMLWVVAAAPIAGFISISDGVNTWTSLHPGITWNADGWYAKNITGGALTITLSGVNTAAYAAQVVEFAGAHKSNPIDTEADVGSGTGNSVDSGATAAATSALDYVIGSGLYTIGSASGGTWSAQTLTSSVTGLTHETAVSAVGSSTAAGVTTSHGQITGLNTEKFTASITNQAYSLLWAYCATIRAAALAAPATGTGAASAATTKESVPASNATGTGAASNATVKISGTAGNAAATGAASNATTKESVASGSAAGTGAASAATPKVAPAVGNAAGTGAASNATVTTGVNAPAENAAGTGAAGTPTTKESVPATLASGTGTASNATAITADDAPAATATGTGTASNATPRISSAGGLASGTGASAAATAKGTTAVGLATGTGAALAATVDLETARLLLEDGGGLATEDYVAGGSVTVSAGHAAGTGTASNALRTTAAGSAAGIGSAYDAAPGLSGSVSDALILEDGSFILLEDGGHILLEGSAAVIINAAGTGDAYNATVNISVLAPAGASGSGSAFDATALTPGATFALAELATGSGSAYVAVGAGSSTLASAQSAAGTGAALNASVVLALPAGAAVGSGAGLEAALTILVALVGIASGTGTAHDAATGPVVVVGASLASGTGTAYDASGPGPIITAPTPTVVGELTSFPRLRQGFSHPRWG